MDTDLTGGTKEESLIDLEGVGHHPDFLYTDIGNADAYARGYGDRVTWIKKLKTLFVWTGQRWQPDDGELVVRYAKELLVELHRQGVETNNKDLVKWAIDCARSCGHINAMINLAKDRFARLTSDLNKDSWLFNCANGTIDLRTGKLKQHDPSDFITKMSPVCYSSDAKAPRFEQFLNEIFDNQVEIIRYMQKFFGYALTAEVCEESLDFWHGLGANGKGVLLTTMLAIWGDYSQTAPTQLIFAQDRRQIPNDVARLFGIRLAIANEGAEGHQFDEQKVKMLTGIEPITARFLNAEWFDFPPSHKLVIVSNYKPKVKNADREDNDSLWRRLRLVPFGVKFIAQEDEEQWKARGIKYEFKDKHLVDKLKSELPGILAWCVEGCLRYQKEGLNPPKEIMLATESYRLDADTVTKFLELGCRNVGDKNKLTKKKDVFTAYRLFCKDAGWINLGLETFYKQMIARGLETTSNKGDFFKLECDHASYQSSNAPMSKSDAHVSDGADTVDQYDTFNYEMFGEPSPASRL